MCVGGGGGGGGAWRGSLLSGNKKTLYEIGTTELFLRKKKEFAETVLLIIDPG